MRSIIAEDAPSALPIPALGPHPRLDRVAAATLEQLSAALIFLSAFDPGTFDHAMDPCPSPMTRIPAPPEKPSPSAQSAAARSASSWNEASTGSTTSATA